MRDLAGGQGWVDRADPSVADMLDLARTALTLDGEDPEVLIIVGTLTALPGGDFSGGIALVDKAIALNPNSAVAFRAAGNFYARAGDSIRALASLAQAERLGPFDNGPTGTGVSAHIAAHFVTGAYDAALEWSDKSLRDRPRSAVALPLPGGVPRPARAPGGGAADRPTPARSAA